MVSGIFWIVYRLCKFHFNKQMSINQTNNLGTPYLFTKPPTETYFQLQNYLFTKNFNTFIFKVPHNPTEPSAKIPINNRIGWYLTCKWTLETLVTRLRSNKTGIDFKKPNNYYLNSWYCKWPLMIGWQFIKNLAQIPPSRCQSQAITDYQRSTHLRTLIYDLQKNDNYFGIL